MSNTKSPDSDEREKLSSLIDGPEQLAAMSDLVLAQLQADHEREIVIITGALESRADDTSWARRARQALRILRLHKSWICNERSARKKKANQSAMGPGLEALAAAKVEAAKVRQETQLQAIEARKARIDAANNEDRKQIAVFKAVAREVLGLEMYEHLWELTRQRLAQGGAA